MKSNSKLLIFSFVIFLSISSCKKDDNIETTNVINVELNENESYSYTIPPVGDDGDVMTISRQAMHYSKSTVTRQSGDYTLFEYAPALDYSGSDEVTIQLKEKGKNNSIHGKCSKKEKDETTYVFKIYIKSAHL